MFPFNKPQEELHYLKKLQNKSSFKDFFDYNFSSLKRFHQSFASKTQKTQIPRSISHSQTTRPLKSCSQSLENVQLMNKFIKSSAYAAKGEPLSSFLSEKPDKNIAIFTNLLENNETPLSFSDRYHDINHLVTLNQKDLQKAGEFYEHFIEFKERIPNNVMKNYCENKERLMSAKDKLQEMAQTKEKLQKNHENKEEFMKKNKKFRIIKKGYKSGIINVDNPENIHTQLYKEELCEIQTKNQLKNELKQKHEKIVEDCTKTSAEIPFFNKNYKENMFKSLAKAKKKHNIEFFQKYGDSKQRIFGENPGKYNKIKWLREKEEREFNIVSLNQMKDNDKK